MWVITRVTSIAAQPYTRRNPLPSILPVYWPDAVQYTPNTSSRLAFSSVCPLIPRASGERAALCGFG
jgi:hypothetical protein